jgi:hypothetical protein
MAPRPIDTAPRMGSVKSAQTAQTAQAKGRGPSEPDYLSTAQAMGSCFRVWDVQVLTWVVSIGWLVLCLLSQNSTYLPTVVCAFLNTYLGREGGLSEVIYVDTTTIDELPPFLLEFRIQHAVYVGISSKTI